MSAEGVAQGAKPTSDWAAAPAEEAAEGDAGERYCELMAAAWMWDIDSRAALRDALAECGLEPDDYDVTEDGACISALRTVAARRLLTPLHLSEPLRTRAAVTAGYLVMEHIRRRERIATILRSPVMADPQPVKEARPPIPATHSEAPPPHPAPPARGQRLLAPLIAVGLCLVALTPPIGAAARLFLRGWVGRPEPESAVWAVWLPVAIGIGTALAGLGVFLSAWLAAREYRSRSEAPETA